MNTLDSQPPHVVGVDLGGTKIMAGVFNAEMECLGFSKLRTKAQKEPEEVLSRIVRCVEEAVEDAKLELGLVKAIGIGAPGPVDREGAQVVFAPNLGWRNMPLKQKLEALLKVPVLLENDCNVCTLGVQAVELRGQPQDLVGIFVGTGIGAGLILGGRLYTGFNRTAGEIGHMVLQVDGPECGCGSRGCFEALASRTAIFKRILAAVEAGQKTMLTDILGTRMTKMRSGSLRKAIARGDTFVEEIIKEAAHYVGIAVANVVNLINPEFVVLGGGLIDQLEDTMMPTIVDTARAHAMPGTMEGISVQASRLADDAGIVGAAVLASRMQHETSSPRGY